MRPSGVPRDPSCREDPLKADCAHRETQQPNRSPTETLRAPQTSLASGLRIGQVLEVVQVAWPPSRCLHGTQVSEAAIANRKVVEPE